MAVPGERSDDVGVPSPKPENSTSQTARGPGGNWDNPEPELTPAPESKGNDAREQMHVSSGSDDVSDKGDDSTNQGVLAHALGILTWAPKRLRYDPDNPPKFGYGLNILYALSSTITVANLYYNQPILNQIAETFDVSYERASSVATLMQAGYAAGLLFICPIGDMVRRKPFITVLVWATAMFWLGLCITDSFAAFSALSFICGALTVTPQLMLPLVGNIAPAHRKGAALSIVVSGLMLGMLIARLLSGVVSNYTDWRNIYWLSFAAQCLLVIFLFFFMPDYPSTNPDGLNYLYAMWTIVKMMFTEPLLVQACVVAFLASAVFTSFWTTLTFLLASPPYEFSSLIIGLFSLIGIVGIVCSPLYGRFVIDRFVPLFSAILGQLMCMTGVVVGTYTGTHTVAGPIIQALFADTGIQMTQIANRAAIYKINPKAMNRVNTAYMVSAFCGQLTGTAVGNRLYAEGGWIWSGSASVGFIGLSLIACFAKGPRETGWVGWSGGWRLRKDDLPAKETGLLRQAVAQEEVKPGSDP